MSYVPGTNVAEVVVQGSMAGQMIDNVIDFQMPDAMTVTILDALANSVIGYLLDHILPLLSSQYTLTSVKATDLTTASSPSVTRFPTGSPGGSIGAGALANNVALVISEGTDLRGRSYRGRLYQAGLPATILADPASISGASRDVIVAAFVDFFDDIEDDNGCIHVIFSRETGGAERTLGVATEVTTYSANTDLDSQRKRLKGRGA